MTAHTPSRWACYPSYTMPTLSAVPCRQMQSSSAFHVYSSLLYQLLVSHREWRRATESVKLREKVGWSQVSHRLLVFSFTCIRSQTHLSAGLICVTTQPQLVFARDLAHLLRCMSCSVFLLSADVNIRAMETDSPMNLGSTNPQVLFILMMRRSPRPKESTHPYKQRNKHIKREMQAIPLATPWNSSMWYLLSPRAWLIHYPFFNTFCLFIKFQLYFPN
jgi:hypothetical protein